MTACKMIEHDLSECQTPEQRLELLREMMVVLGELDHTLTDEPHLLEFETRKQTFIDPPLRKAAHQ